MKDTKPLIILSKIIVIIVISILCIRIFGVGFFILGGVVASFIGKNFKKINRQERWTKGDDHIESWIQNADTIMKQYKNQNINNTDNSITKSSNQTFIFASSSTIMGLIKPILKWIIGIMIIRTIAKGSYFIVDPGQVAFLVRFGTIGSQIYGPGLYFKAPWIDKKIVINTQIQKNEATASSASSDLQDVTAEIALNYSIDPDKAKELYQTVGSEEDVESRLISPAIQEAVKAATAKYVASQLITERVKVKSDILAPLKDKLEPRGIKIIDLNIVNFQFSAAFNQAIESKVRAEQDALAEKNKLEQIKFQAQQQIESAKAEAEKIKIQAEAITKQGGKEYVQLQWIAKRNGQLPKVTSSDNGGMILQITDQ